ncbi:Putative transmembrane oxidoreductase protein [hydrothermal vent metagenome]|uniref:Transmembrane oxidoreductase protein n=1 Tax=hydrothermal vent metagenome TaxID=652676 RepID=A0A3B1BG60_9ZZZZ
MNIQKDSKIIIPGAAGLVGQNLIVQLKKQGYTNLVAIDKFTENLNILKKIHPDIIAIDADVSRAGDWQAQFKDADMVLMLQAQIGSKYSDDFIRNNVESAKIVLATMKEYAVPYVVHISSSVVESVADDDYTNTKKEQERLVLESGIKHCVLRPTLMFGWFDRKHLGWLSRFMQRIPVFPIPGDGCYMRQPLYAKDFCNIIVGAMEMQPENEIYNITGREKVDYIDMIRCIRDTVKAKTWIVNIPYSLFWILLKVYALFSNNPPFTASQLKALVAHDEFELIPWWKIFKIESTPFKRAIEETFLDKTWSQYVLKF